jgi:hypothetical protein
MASKTNMSDMFEGVFLGQFERVYWLFWALFEPDGGCFVLRVGVEVFHASCLFVLSRCVIRRHVSNLLMCMHVMAILFFAAAGSGLFCGAILRR